MTVHRFLHGDLRSRAHTRQSQEISESAVSISDGPFAFVSRDRTLVSQQQLPAISANIRRLFQFTRLPRVVVYNFSLLIIPT
jgi:hypothetical protein